MEVVVRPATALYVDAHALEHLKLLSIAVDLKDFSLVLLEESDEGELWFLRLGVAKVCSRLGCGKQINVVVLTISLKSSFEVLGIPFHIIFTKISSS